MLKKEKENKKVDSIFINVIMTLVLTSVLLNIKLIFLLIQDGKSPFDELVLSVVAKIVLMVAIPLLIKRDIERG